MQTEWPALSFADAKETYATLHMWTQIVGKIKLHKLPWINHSWHVTLLVTPKGLTTSHIIDGETHFEIDFNFLTHHLEINTGNGQSRDFPLQGLSVAGFYKNIMAALNALNIQADINPVPNELPDPIPFTDDETHATYQPEQVTLLHQALLNAQEVFTQFRAGYKGKCSPVHFFWGGFDLAVTRFSGREAPKHPGGVPHLPDWVAQEAYSHEVSSCGFWPGNEMVPFAIFYSYVYPEPEGFKDSKVKPADAYYHPELREFILPYSVVQQAENPSFVLMDFLRSTYNAAADLAGWDRQTLEYTFSH